MEGKRVVEVGMGVEDGRKDDAGGQSGNRLVRVGRGVANRYVVRV